MRETRPSFRTAINSVERQVTVRRGRVLEDAISQLAHLPACKLKGRLHVVFKDQLTGRSEAGVDAGGLFKEFWTELSHAVFSADYALFKTTQHDGLLYPNPDSAFVHGAREHLDLFHFVGRVRTRRDRVQGTKGKFERLWPRSRVA